MSYTIDEYAKMLADPVRGDAYLRAVRESVRAGAVVADIGAGPGVLGVYAATLGARRVYLIDPDGSVYAGAALAKENGVADRVEVIRAASTDIELPERADVIVSDLRGVLPFHGGHLQAAADMRQRLLSPGGVCIPRRDVVMTALLEDQSLHDRTVGAWSRLPSSLAHASLSRLVANGWYRARATETQLLSEPSQFVELDYDRAAPSLSRKWEVRAARDGTAHGLLAWFDSELTETIGFSNSPAAPAALYGQAFFPFAPAIPVRRDELLTLELRGVLSGDDYAWSWSAATESGATARHATLHAIVMHPDSLARRAESFVPDRSVEGEVLRALLEATDGRVTLGDLAKMLAERFPARFPTRERALDYVSQLDDLWTT